MVSCATGPSTLSRLPEQAPPPGTPSLVLADPVTIRGIIEHDTAFLPKGTYSPIAMGSDGVYYQAPSHITFAVAPSSIGGLFIPKSAGKPQKLWLRQYSRRVTEREMQGARQEALAAMGTQFAGVAAYNLSRVNSGTEVTPYPLIPISSPIPYTTGAATSSPIGLAEGHQFGKSGFCTKCGWSKQFLSQSGRSCAP